MDMFLQIIVGALTVFLLGLRVKPLIKRVKTKVSIERPSEIEEEQWKRLTGGNEGGEIIGNLERFLFLGAFWIQSPAIIATWFAFKVASKWNAWSNVISLPKSLPDVNEIEYLIARRRWGSQLLATFLVGTISNLIIGLVGFLIGRHGYDFARSLLC